VNEVEIKRKEVNFIIWIIPLISLIVGGWLVYKYYVSLGPLITVKFKNSGGLEAKRSFVKFRDVKVGRVESIEILKDEGVLVKIRMEKSMKPFLNSSTKFWIVKPEISINKVRGLDALLSGPYIQMYAKPNGFDKTFFRGLEEPPLNAEIVNGKVYKLVADRAYGIEEGMPIYYKDMKVGVVRRVVFKNNKVTIYIVVWKRYDKYINNSTKFWNLKNINISFKENSINAKLPPFKALLFGGIEFDTPFDKDKNKTVFKLYASKNMAFKHSLTGNRYVDINFTFDKDVSKLQTGDIIKFRGYKIGDVKKILSFYDVKKNKIITKVLASVNIGVFHMNLDKILKKGVVIKFNNSFLGDYLIFDFDKKYRGRIFTDIEKSETLTKINRLLDKLNSLPLNKLIKDTDVAINTLTPALNKTLNSISLTSKNANNVMLNTSKNLNITLKRLSNLSLSLEKLTNTYDKNSLFYDKSTTTLKNINKAFYNLNKILNKLDKKPNSIILGD